MIGNKIKKYKKAVCMKNNAESNMTQKKIKYWKIQS